jgi:hypothetical protein
LNEWFGRRTAGEVIFTFFWAFIGKNDPHIGVLAGFLRFRGGKICGEIHLDLKGL